MGGRRKCLGLENTTKFEAHGARFILLGTTIGEADGREKKMSGPRISLKSTTKFEAHWARFILLVTTIGEADGS